MPRIQTATEHLLSEARAVAGAEHTRAEEYRTLATSRLTTIGQLVHVLARTRGVDEAVIRLEQGITDAPEPDEEDDQ